MITRILCWFSPHKWARKKGAPMKRCVRCGIVANVKVRQKQEVYRAEE